MSNPEHVENTKEALLNRVGICVLDKSIRAAITVYNFVDGLTRYPVPKVEDVTDGPLRGFKKVTTGWLSGYYSIIREEDLQDLDGVDAQLCKERRGGLVFRMVNVFKGGQNG